MDRLVEEIVAKIVDAYRPAQIVLFGSRARGEAGPESDVDLLVVYDGPLSRREAEMGIRRLFTPQTFSMDLVVLTSDAFQRQKQVVSTIGRIADREGVLCLGGWPPRYDQTDGGESGARLAHVGDDGGPVCRALCAVPSHPHPS